MNWQLIIGSGGLVGIGAIIFYLGRIVAKFEAKFDAIDKKIDGLKDELKEIRKDLSVISSRLDRLEVRVEERTLKVFHVQKGTERVLENV